MKQLLLFLLTTFLFYACGTPSSIESQTLKPQSNALTGISGFFDVDSVSSTFNLQFKDRSNSISGISFPIHAGKMALENDALVGGSFILQQKGKYQPTSPSEKLLASSSWFRLEKHPQASITISMVNPYMIGSPEADADTAKNKIQDPNLTVVALLRLKDTSIQINFPAKFTVSSKQISFKANFYINRTNWKIGPAVDTVKNQPYFQPNTFCSFNFICNK